MKPFSDWLADAGRVDRDIHRLSNNSVVVFICFLAGDVEVGFQLSRPVRVWWKTLERRLVHKASNAAFRIPVVMLKQPAGLKVDFQPGDR